MVEIAKNHAQLTDEEREREKIEYILIKIVRELQKSLDKYRGHKELATKATKVYNSDVNRSAIFLSLFSMNLKPGQKLAPKQIGEKLPENIRINPRELTEGLKKVQKGGFFVNIKGKPKDKHPGRPKAGENISHKRKGGPHSYYIITEGLGELKKLLSNSEATQLIHDHLKRDGIIQEYYKLFLLAGYYTIRKESGTKEKIFDLIAPFYISQISENDYSEMWDNYVNLLRSLNDKELDLLAERTAHKWADSKRFNSFMYLLQLMPM